MFRCRMLVTLAVVCLLAGGVAANWNEWWTYDGISGPAYWGLINPAWTMCNKVTPQCSEQAPSDE